MSEKNEKRGEGADILMRPVLPVEVKAARDAMSACIRRADGLMNKALDEVGKGEEFTQLIAFGALWYAALRTVPMGEMLDVVARAVSENVVGAHEAPWNKGKAPEDMTYDPPAAEPEKT